jgi:hypothetical protein
MAKKHSKDSKPKLDASAGGPRYHGGHQPGLRTGSAAGHHGKRGHEAGPGGGDAPGRHTHAGHIGTRHPHRASSASVKISGAS